MKQQLKCKWIFGLFATALFASCSGFFDLGSEEIEEKNPDAQKPSTTYVQVNNTANKYPVDIYYDNTRQNKVVSVSGHQNSDLIPQTPTMANPRSFFISYNLDVITGVQIPYIPKGAEGVISLHINKNETTQVVIKSLSDIIGADNADDALFDNIWLTIKNNGNSACRLTYFTTFVKPENLPTFDFNPGNTALYKFDSEANLSQIIINNNSSLPAEIPAFRKGYLYEVEFNGTTAALKSSKPLTMNTL